MSPSYISVFKRNIIINRRILCEILGLDTTRPGLIFTAEEINRAYRRRALRLHPDKQLRLPAEDQLPQELCTALMEDILRAKNHLLAGDDNIPGQAWQDSYFPSGNSPDYSTDQILDSLIVFFKNVKDNLSTSLTTLKWFAHISHPLFFLLVLASFSEGVPNFDMLRSLPKGRQKLALLNWKLVGPMFGNVLRGLLPILEENKGCDEDKIKQALQKKFPTFFSISSVNSMVEREKFHTLLSALKTVMEELPRERVEHAISDIEKMISFWPDMIANIPTLTHLIGLYVLTMLFTAHNYPKVIQAMTSLFHLMKKEKGAGFLWAISFPWLLLTAVLLPLNLISNLVKLFGFVAGELLVKSVASSLKLLRATVMLAVHFFHRDNVSLSLRAQTFLDSLWNATLGLLLHAMVGIIDSMIYLLTGQKPMIQLVTAMQKISEKKVPSENALAIQVAPAAPTTHQRPSTTFFSPSSSEGRKDIWLNEILGEVKKMSATPPVAVASATV